MGVDKGPCMQPQSVHWTPIIVCCGHLLLVSPGYYLLKCTEDINFGVRIGTNLGHQIWCTGTQFFYSVAIDMHAVLCIAQLGSHTCS